MTIEGLEGDPEEVVAFFHWWRVALVFFGYSYLCLFGIKDLVAYLMPIK